MVDKPPFPDSDGSSDFDEDTSTLPFPEPLSRASFLTPGFDPAQYLSSLRNRHQSLEDLRQELRDLDQLLSRELLDLVNENYQDFLSLGNALHGGEEKAEEVRVGLLAFQRDVNAIRHKVETRRAEVEGLLGEKKQLRKDANVGQALLDVAERIEELEQRLMIGEKNNQGQREQSDEESDGFLEESDESESDDEQAPQATAAAVSLKRLEHHIQKYVAVTRLSAHIGDEHPFLLNQQPRVNKIRSAVLHDLKTALEQAKNAGKKRDAKMLSVLGLYELMGENPSAITALKNLKL
ncbi:COG2 family protein [Aspergillus chevalieri]|uniref:Conserved oligomeric Golgi complex subunit 2 n=1 Tax=Aspergillus chevalieri TaxID=182096 RepID=A0A7R7VUE1_ASPCH|nr:uncharacterized protein ACHE_60872S [Aspergillus chevalieri]BCR90986.1 hypothetical protein ACHE_60872S [Aspergillus chevalieri]